MRGLVFHGDGQRSWDTVPDARLHEPTDALVQVDTASICGTDLHILSGEVPDVEPGRILGHEAVGRVVEVGSTVRRVRTGDRVVVSCITACGYCRYCREQRYGQCLGGGGWLLGRTIDGTQAEYVRVPHADLSLHPLPDWVEGRDAVQLADIFPSAYEMGVLNGRIRPGDTVVVVGAGPVGLATIATAQMYAPTRIVAVDVVPSRLEAAKQVGADVVAQATEHPERLVSDLTDGLGADVAIEAVGLPETFELCVRTVRPGGRIANIGVHGRPVTLHLEWDWERNLTITTGRVDSHSTPTLLALLTSGRLPGAGLITHNFTFDQMEEAYDVFARNAETGALKVAIGGERHSPLVAPP